MKKGITAILLMIVLSYSAFALVGHNPSEIFPGTFSGHFKFENVTIMNQGNSSFLTIENNITSPEVCISGDCRTAWPTSGGDSLWVNSSGNATFTTGNVGIGKLNPGEKLDVSGNINATGDICITGGNCLSSVSGGSATQSNWSVPYGSIMAFNGTSCPAGWIPADGTAGTPNMTGRVVVGLDSGDSDFNESGKTGGEKEHQLTVSEMPSHNHDFGGTAVGSGSAAYAGSGTQTNTQSEGGNQPHNNLQPYTSLIYCMKNTDEAGSYVGASPSFSVHKNGVNQGPITASSNVKVTWSTKEFDTHDDFDLSNNRYTPSVPGKYLITAAADMADMQDGYAYRLFLYKNGVQYAQGSKINPGANAGESINVLSTVVDADGDDYFEIYVWHNDGDAGSEVVSGSTFRTYFAGSRIDGGNGLWTPDSGNISYTAGNVGIGTTGPESKLHIDSGVSDSQIKIGQLGSVDSIWSINDADSAYNDLRVDAGNLLLNSYSSGNVGIGTSSPEVDLNVHSSSISRFKLSTDLSGNGATTDGFDIVFSNNNHTYIVNREEASLYLGTNGISHVRINSDGKVGIGTTSPNGRLEVRNSDNTVPTVRISTPASTSTSPSLELYNTGQKAYSIILNDSDGSLRFVDTSTGFPGTGNERMTIASNGDVGIGTNNPLYNLEVGDGSGVSQVGVIASPSNPSRLILEENGQNTTYITRYNSKHSSQPNKFMIEHRVDNSWVGSITMDADGNVGIGTAIPQATLDVAGSVRIGITGGGTGCSSSSDTGKMRYYEQASGSWLQICMKTGSSSYGWHTIQSYTW